jgi:hypothetical protein
MTFDSASKANPKHIHHLDTKGLMTDISDFPKGSGSNYSDNRPVFPTTETGFDKQQLSAHFPHRLFRRTLD